MRTFRYALAGAWAAAVLAVLFCIATDPALFHSRLVRNVGIVAAGAAIVGLALGWLVAPRDHN